MNFTYDRVLGVVEKYKCVDIFPYKIQDVNNFIFRDHIPYREGNKESWDYARDVFRKIVEGHWVNDNGTWVFMLPKLYFYINLGTITLRDIDGESKTRHDDYPRLRDNGWIIFTYILCCDGFSGFKDDPDFTCNRSIKELEDGIEISSNVMNRLKKNCVRKDGTWKKYVEAWDYLTWFYNKENPRPFPLGLPIYENESTNGMILGSRKSDKTACLTGDCVHEFYTNGATYWEDLKKKASVRMFVGSSDSNYVKTFMQMAGTCFNNIPGVHWFPHGHFSKVATPNWDEHRDSVIQKFRKDDGSYGGSFSQIDKAILLPNKAEVVVSARVKRMYIDEVGLQANVKAIHEAADAAMKEDVGKFGVFLYSGTGGNIDRIEGTQELYYNTNQFNLYPIPNYWHDNNPIGLFIPASYTFQEYKNENGNTDVIGGTKHTLKERARVSGGDPTKVTFRRMNEPLEPMEIFLVGKSDHFDKETVIDRIDVLQRGEWKRRGRVYELQMGRHIPEGQDQGLYEIHAEVKENRWHNVVTNLDYQGRTGELVVFEPPMHDGPGFLEFGNLYKVVYDPKTDLETGKSYAAIYVYKGLPNRSLEVDELYNNIVAEAKIKTDDEDHHLVFLMLCLWYRSKGQYERNVSGIPDFFSKYGLKWVLQPTPLALIKDITPGTKQTQQSGIFITDDLKIEGLRMLKKWHKAIVNIDENNRKFKQIETFYGLAGLWEMNYYDEEGNYDCISALIILMLWLRSEYIPDNSRLKEDFAEEIEWEDLARAAKRITSQ